MKRYITPAIALLLCFLVYIPVLSVENPAFTVKISGTLDADNTFNGKDTLVLEWQIRANRPGLTLGNAQGLRIAYDNTVLQLIRWDASDAISESTTGTTFKAASARAGHTDIYDTVIRVSTAKSAVGGIGYLSILTGSDYDTYACPHGAFFTLLQFRFAFKPGKSAADLTGASIRCMTVGELAATAQSTAILINTTENGLTSYEYLKQERGVAVGMDKLNAPSVTYPNSDKRGDTMPDESQNPKDTSSPTAPAESDAPPSESKPQESDAPPSESNPAKPGDSLDNTSSTIPDTPSSNNNPKETDDVSSYTNPYADVLSKDWYYNAVKYVTAKKLMNGSGNSKFSPNEIMTRAMFATVLHRLANNPSVTGKNVFADVQDGQWYTDAIRWASESKLIIGYGDGKFGLNDNITREQAVTILYRYSMATGLDISGQADLSKYKDSAMVSDWALDAVRWAVSAGIISGRSTASLDAQGKITRAEVAQILLNLELARTQK